nr:hypothetical protein [Tanacetum cinerariifolium]
MERGFFCSSKRGRGVKEKDKHGTATGSVMESDGIVNDVTPLVDSVVKEVGSPYVVDEIVAKEKQSSLVNTTGLGSYPPLPTQETTLAGNALGKSSYDNHMAFLGKRVAYPVVANYVRNTWGKYELDYSMFRSSIGLFSFQFSSMDGLDSMLENGPWFIRNNPLILKKWNPNENLLKEDGYYTCNVCVEYEWKPPRCSSCNVFGHIHDVEFGTNGGTTNLVNNEATLSGSSFMNIDNDGEFASNAPIGVKIDKIERQICEGKLRQLDNDGNLLVATGIMESNSEVEVVFNETANLRISKSGKDRSDK